MTYTKPSEWLASLDSHTLYPANMLTEIPGVTVLFDQVPGPAGGPIAALYRNDHQGSPVRTSLESLATVAKHPGKAGVTLNPDFDPTELVFSGFYIAGRLATLFLGTSPGGAKLGRGSAFRADLEALAAAGF